MGQSSKISILTKNTAWVYIGKIGTQILALITSILVLKKLDVDVYGTYSLLIKFIIIYNVFSFSPIASVFNRYIPELMENNQSRRFKRLIYIGLLAILISAFIITLLIFNFSSPISDFLNIPNFETYKIALFAYLAAMILRESMTAVLTSSLLHKYTSIFLLTSTFLRSVLLVVLLPILDVNIFLYVETITSLIYIIPGVVILSRFLKKMSIKEDIKSKNPVSRKRVIRFGLFSSLNELGAGIVGKTSDYFIVSAMSNLHNVGLYAFATKIYDLIFKLLPFKEFMTVVRPLFFQKFTKDYDDKEFQNIFNFMIKAMMPVYVVPVLYFMVFGKSVITYVFDPKYIEAYAVSVLVLTSNIYYAFFFPIALIMHLKERMDIGLYSKVVVVFSILAGIFAMKYFGIVGVAFATLIGDFSKNVFILVLLRKEVRIVYRFKQYINYLIIFATINIPFFVISYIYPTIPVLIGGSVLYFIITYLAIIKFHPFNEFDLQILERIGQSNKSARLARKVILKTHGLKLFNKHRK